MNNCDKVNASRRTCRYPEARTELENVLIITTIIGCAILIVGLITVGTWLFILSL